MTEMTREDSEMRGISVLTMNIRFGLANDGPNGWEFRKEGYPELLTKYRSDFMAFQEVNDFQGEYIGRILRGHKSIGKRSPAPEYWQNNIVFFDKNWTCVEWGHFYLSDEPDKYSKFADSRWPRQCTIGLFEKGPRRLVFVNTHFDFDPQVQVKSARVIMDLLERFPSDAPAILVGDFNCPPSMPCRKVFTGLDERSPESGGRFFKPVFREPFPGTFHKFTGQPGADQIDWILYRGDIAPRKGIVIRERFAGIYPSDHFPLYAEFD